MHLINKIKEFHKSSKNILFTTPGHCQGTVIPPNVENILGKKIFQSDLSEIIGLDNIREPHGLFLESQKKAAEIYNSSKSFYLYNGSTSGILALMLTLLKENDKVIIGRNAHTAVINGLILTGANPVWVKNRWLKDWGVTGAIDIDDLIDKIKENTDAKAVFLTNPTYEGIVYDLSMISDLCKEKNIPLVVDEAHGALWNFSDLLPDTAISQGADASVQSLHKTAGALTQASIMHLGQDTLIDSERLQSCLNLINSTSPSYPILASIEGTIEYLNSKNGKNKIYDLIRNVKDFKKTLCRTGYISFLPDEYSSNYDITKIFAKIDGCTGHLAADLLFEKHRIEVELDNEIGFLAYTGIGTTKERLNLLKNALLHLQKHSGAPRITDMEEVPEPYMATTCKKAYFSEKKQLPLKDAIGYVSGDLIVPYPPGIPIVIPGEVIRDEHLIFLEPDTTINVCV